MKYVYSLIEQLDLAGKQLEHVHPSYARFALLLVDNTMELMLHQQCKKAIHADELFRVMGTPKYNAKERERALGQRMSEKIAFCHKLGVITADEGDFIRIGHNYRNELYHVGVRHDLLIYPLAWEYHALVCALFERFELGGVTWYAGEQPSEVARKHWPKTASPFGAEGAQLLKNAARSLHATKPPLVPTFACQVSAYACAAVGEIDDALEFLVHDTPRHGTEEQVLNDIQFSHFIQSEEGELALALQEGSSAEEYFQRRDKVEATWKPRYRTRPTPRWRDRAIALARLDMPADALLRYTVLRNEMKPFEETVFAAASQLDAWIQHQIDVYRGK